MTTTTADSPPAPQATVFPILFAIGFCHALNDMMQSLLQAIYPNLQKTFDLDFAHIGLITFVYQVTASLLQPLVGHYTDRRAVPYALPIGMVFTFIGLILLAIAPNYPLLLAAAMIVGVGSSTFHPESSRVAHAAAGPRRGLAQSMFQSGGSIGGALGPLLAAVVVGTGQRAGIAWFSVAALLAIVILWRVGTWYRDHGLARAKHAIARAAQSTLSPAKVRVSLGILVILIFSKFVYLASLSSYFTFYLIHKFHISVPSAQVHLFIFLAAVAVGTICGGPLGDRFGRKHLIWFSILGALPFTLAMPFANLFWTSVLSVGIGHDPVLGVSRPSWFIGQELLPGRVGMISGLFFGLSLRHRRHWAPRFSAWLADHTQASAFRLSQCLRLPARDRIARRAPARLAQARSKQRVAHRVAFAEAALRDHRHEIHRAQRQHIQAHALANALERRIVLRLDQRQVGIAPQHT
jgi:FSR family fosmidomycin resistance protein-like MFS transporter